MRHPTGHQYDSSDDEAPIEPVGKAAAKMREEAWTVEHNKKPPNKHSGGCKPFDKPHRKDDEDDPDSDNSGHQGRTIRGNVHLNLSYGQGGGDDSTPIFSDEHGNYGRTVEIMKHPELMMEQMLKNSHSLSETNKDELRANIGDGALNGNGQDYGEFFKIRSIISSGCFAISTQMRPSLY